MTGRTLNLSGISAPVSARDVGGGPVGGAELVGYFGYGSLVNRATLSGDIVAACRARLKGWRRSWLARPVMDAQTEADFGSVLPDGSVPALLSAHPFEDASIDGLLVIDRAGRLPEIDMREIRYHRRDISLSDLELIGPLDGLEPLIGGEIKLYVYEARTEWPLNPGPSPILRSYLDAVMQGFLKEYGEDGVYRFVAETGDFRRPVYEDRDAPIYPRAVRLTDHEIALFDQALQSLR